MQRREEAAMSEVTVRKATPNDMHQLGRTLALAFRDDPAWAWAAPNVKRRERFLPRYFELLTRRVYLPKGEVYVTEDGAAAALWAPPNKWQTPTTATLPLFPITLRLCGRKFPVAWRMINLAESKHEKHVEPHYYLGFIGTAPATQGRGYGTTLLNQMLERCDAEGVPAYLESSSVRNQALYHRHGFEVLEELHWPRDGPPFWPMWRKPR
jgi:ribosomal protein S18 acetylase RimI-like enzyme